MDDLDYAINKKMELNQELDIIKSTIRELTSKQQHELEAETSKNGASTEILQISQNRSRTLTSLISQKDIYLNLSTEISKHEREISRLLGQKHGIMLGFWLGLGSGIALSITAIQIF